MTLVWHNCLAKYIKISLSLFLITLVFNIQAYAQELIANVDSYDSLYQADNDEVYMVGTRVNISVIAQGNLSNLTGTVSISSSTTGYNSDSRAMDNIGSGNYQYIWNTTGLTPASDYLVTINLRNAEGQIDTDNSIRIELYSGNILLKSVSSADSSNPEDNDMIYHSGQIINVIAEYVSVAIPIGTVDINSQSTGYSSKVQRMQKGEGSKLEYKWDTTGLKQADDYIVTITLDDAQLHRVADSSLIISINNTPPTIARVFSYDRIDTADNDGIYHAGQSLAIDAVAGNNETGLAAMIQIKSDAVSYDSGQQIMTDQGNGTYRYIWTTTDLNPAKDYNVIVIIKNKPGIEAVNSKLIIEIDNSPPQNGQLIINDDDKYTTSKSVKLSIFSDNAKKMYISGDIADDVSTFEWIPYATELSVELSGTDGIKNVSARFIDDAKNESLPATDSIILDALPPVIKSILSQDDADATDNDGIYHAGQLITITAITDGSEPEALDGNVQIISTDTKYNSGIQKLSRISVGNYIYRWDTTGISESKNYNVLVNFKDPSDREVSDVSQKLIIDNSPPSGGNIQINGGSEKTDSRSVKLDISSIDGGPTEMFISGDIFDDTNTLEWIPYNSEVIVNLAGDDGKKEVKSKFRDAAKNESGTIVASITLDRQTPVPISIKIQDEAKYTKTRDVSLKIQAEGAKEIFVFGDITNDENTFKFINYKDSLNVQLNPGDGEKVIGVFFKSASGTQSDSIQSTIILDTKKPVISLIGSWDSENPEDNDGVYHPGQSLVINAKAEAGEVEISAKIRISSVKTGYDTGEQVMGLFLLRNLDIHGIRQD